MSVPLTRHYPVVEKEIAHEIIDGEAIIIHFETGNYYSLNGTAATLWSWIEAGATYGEMTGAFQSLAPEDKAGIDHFLQELVCEGVLTESDEPVSGNRRTDLLPAAGKHLFEVPAFDKYNDMQHLLQADPIHEVDERGWPHQPDA